ncbi:hypothetical protein [Terrabacter sp. Root181]|uniref:hypothetical protein n=1 Tax=Terrabacter sp. Root181 TaxID=1736484 RepID=UPI0006F4746B|nr:hypothetical protein [Terrabacter sp. Root181]KRB45014.1 hypothetical protein ASD90_15070 [Terrabacter sp. Root181]
MHPTWCDLGDECQPDANGDSAPDQAHKGDVTRFRPEHDDAWVAIKMVHHEDVLAGHDHGQPGVHLEIQDASFGSADVLLTPDDIRILRKTLERYELDLAHDHYWTTREALGANAADAPVFSRTYDGEVREVRKL